ncbi:MAG: Glu/Leu/Phe/Val dehydrogenase dimerization domain-containing protein [Thermoplasmata archaeon]
MGAIRSWTFEASGLEAFVVLDRWGHGLGAGGLRFSPIVTPGELERLALTMSRKWAILDLPFDGAKLGIQGDPGKADKEAALRAFGRAARGVMRDRVVTGPDLGTNSRDISAFYKAVGQDPYRKPADRLRELGFHPTPRSVYARFLRELGEKSTGLAVTRAALAAWEQLHPSGELPTVSIQGYGSVGRTVAEEMARRGARVLCVADADGSLRHPEGLDVELLRGSQPGTMNRSALPTGTEEAPREAWMEWESDLLVPASIPDAINRENVGQVKAKMIVEAANIPVQEDVEDELQRRGVFVLPDFLVNGGAAAAYGLLLTQEWREQGSLLQEIYRRIVGATKAVVNQSINEGRNPREVAIKMAEARFKPSRPLPP